MSEGKTSRISRRSFIKIGAMAGTVLNLGGFGFAAYKAGKDPGSHTGWESFGGDTQFFNRTRFEFDGPAYNPVSETRRPARATDYIFGREGLLTQNLMEGWTPEQGIDALGEPLASFYKEDQEAFELDMLRHKEIYPKAAEDHAKYDPYFALAYAHANGWEELFNYYPLDPTEPPEISDYKYTRFGLLGPEETQIGDPMPFKSPDHASELIKKMAHLYGATVVGIAKLNPDYLYDVNIRGGEPGPFKKPDHWEFAIVVGVPHEWEQMLSNPAHGTSYDGYNRARNASARLATFIKSLGYPARSHHPPVNYDLVVPPIAVDAGVGQLGRHGFVICPETGSNIRLACVTTNVPMTVDKPIDFGVTDFCNTCKICAEACPSDAISMADSPDGMELRGYEHWHINTTRCFNFWMQAMGPLGCRLCLTDCPYSRRDNWVHKMSRAIDVNDPTGLSNDGLVWMQKTAFDWPEAEEYLPPPDGRFAGYRPAPDWLDVEEWFDISPLNPQEGA